MNAKNEPAENIEKRVNAYIVELQNITNKALNDHVPVDEIILQLDTLHFDMMMLRQKVLAAQMVKKMQSEIIPANGSQIPPRRLN